MIYNGFHQLADIERDSRLQALPLPGGLVGGCRLDFVHVPKANKHVSLWGRHGSEIAARWRAYVKTKRGSELVTVFRNGIKAIFY
jgi:hypothetical protein